MNSGNSRFRKVANNDTDQNTNRVQTKLQNLNIEKVRVSDGIQVVTYHSELLAAFKEDCEQLLLAFAEKQCYTYKTFALIWRELDFGQVLEGEDSTEHMVTFLENCFFQLKKYIIFSKNLFIQVGAFYMVYTIYFKQPKSGLVKVRWTYDEYSALLKLLEQSLNCNNDFSFIFNKMHQSNAFLFVAETRRWGIEPKYAHEEKKLKDDIFGHDMNYARVKSKIFCKDFFGIDTMEEVYKEYQDGLAEYLAEHPEHKAMSAFQTLTYIQDLKTNCENFESKNNKETAPSSSQVATEKSIYNKRQAIKNKALKLENYSSRSLNAMQTD